MENLQQKVSEVPVKKGKADLRDETKSLYEARTSYEGLNLVENVNYSGGTSIKYWM